jgi:hypothetical protein
MFVRLDWRGARYTVRLTVNQERCASISGLSEILRLPGETHEASLAIARGGTIRRHLGNMNRASCARFAAHDANRTGNGDTSLELRQTRCYVFVETIVVVAGPALGAIQSRDLMVGDAFST